VHIRNHRPSSSTYLQVFYRRAPLALLLDVAEADMHRYSVCILVSTLELPFLSKEGPATTTAVAYFGVWPIHSPCER
jgi:hypothetical protein